jgi:hypothetical protein
MSVAELNSHIGQLRKELEWRSGPVHKIVSKLLEVAVKVRELRIGQAAAGDV